MSGLTSQLHSEILRIATSTTPPPDSISSLCKTLQMTKLGKFGWGRRSRNEIETLITTSGWKPEYTPDKFSQKSKAKESEQKENIENGESKPKKRKIETVQQELNIPETRYSHVAGLNHVIQRLQRDIHIPLTHPELYRHLKQQRISGFILHGPTGCGKTLIAKAIAGEAQYPLLHIHCHAEMNLKHTFATINAHIGPAVLLLDDIDVIKQKDILIGCIDELNSKENGIILVATTNRPDAIDPALRRSGRFEKEIMIDPPNLSGRKQILETLTSQSTVSADFSPEMIARETPGYVGADLKSLMVQASQIAIDEFWQQHFANVEDFLAGECPSTDKLEVTNEHYIAALPLVQPSAKRAGFATPPDVTFSQIGALAGIQKQLMSLLHPLRFPSMYLHFRLPAPSGLLLWGPPGCGKTLLAKALANQTCSSFISIKGPELLNKYVGESEAGVRRVFERARSARPCIIFFDEMDALVPIRDGGEGSSVSNRVVNALLTEMDGLQSRDGVFVVGATNRPDIIDPAILRPGRLDKKLYVSLPTPEERIDILQTICKLKPLSPEVDLPLLGKDPRMTRFSGADLDLLVREAATIAIEKIISSRESTEVTTTPDVVMEDRSHWSISSADFEEALCKARPSVREEDLRVFEEIRMKYETA